MRPMGFGMHGGEGRSRSGAGHRPMRDMDAANAKSKRSVKETLTTLPQIWELIRPRRALLAGGLVLMAINRVSGLVLPASTKFLIDDVVGKHNTRLLVPLVGAILLATLVQGATSFALTQSLSKEAQRLIAELRRKVQEHVGRLPVAYYDANRTGALVSRIMSDVEGVRNLIGTGLVDFTGGLLTAAIALVVLVRISPMMTGLAFLFVMAFGLALQQAFRIIRPIFVERARITAEVTGRLTETLGGVRVVKGFHAEAREHDVFSKGVGRLLDNVLRTLTAVSLLSLSSTVMTGMVGAAVMFFGARQVVSGAMTLGDFIMYTTFLAFLVMPLIQTVNIGTQLTEAVAGLERTREILAEHPEDEDPRRTVALGRLEGEIVFENVRFAYDEGKTVLHDVSFHADAGSVTALVGSSGSGKSTIIGLIAAFHMPQEGRILVDGADLSNVRLDSYRTQLGVVLQDSFLFDGTIRENVAFAYPGATEEQILAACRIAHVDEFADRFENKYDTVIGERGIKLSGGQRQRVSIARAVLANPRILILDEATSSLDSESEALIQEGMGYLLRGRTTFVIAHRLSTIRRADQILVVEDGRIVERGDHAALFAAHGRYYDLYTRQHGLEANLFLAPGEGDAVAADAAENGGGPSSRKGPGSEPDAIGILRGRTS
jgi:ABC-type multidrug transport system fused ATPase/permease subunit